MRSKRRGKYNPLTDLIMNIRVAARQIDIAQSRAIAAREADKIPLTQLERAHGAKGKMARLARSIMRELPTMTADRYPDAVSVLRGCADAIASRFEVTSEEELGRRRRHNERAA